MAFNYITAEEAAAMIKDGDSIGSSGFTAPGSPKMISQSLAAKAEKEHAEGRPFKINIFTGASTSDKYDGMLARANAINMRAPYQNLPDLRKRINAHDAHYFDRHLSEMAQEMRYGFYGKLDWAIIEAAHVSPDGEIVLGCGVGNVATYAALADRIFIELNSKLPESLMGMHDIYTPLDPRTPRDTHLPSQRPHRLARAQGRPPQDCRHRQDRQLRRREALHRPRRGEQADRQQRGQLPHQRV